MLIYGGYRMKVLASDYDGTLCIDHQVSKENIQAITRFRNAGNLFGIVTGRSMESLQKEMNTYQLSCDFIITNNGGVLFDKHAKRLLTKYMEFSSALAIIAYIKQTDCVSYVINDGYHRYKFLCNAKAIDYKYAKLEDSNGKEDEVLAKGNIAQIVVSLQEEQIAHSIANYINTYFQDVAQAYVNVHCVDIVPQGVSKANGIFDMQSYVSFLEEDVYAIGDSYNDLSMLEAFCGCTLSHANDDIKESAQYIFDSVASCIDFIMGKEEL